MKIKLNTHSFSTSVAEEVGILAAVILHNIYFWVAHNEKNNINYHDGHYWTYNSATAFQEQFTYATVDQIRAAIIRLRDSGFIITSNYNKAPYDRTLWYTVTDKAIAIMGGQEANNNPPATPEPVQQQKEEKYKDEIKEIIDYLNSKVGSRYRYTSETNNRYIRARLNEKFTVDDFKKVIDNKVQEWTGTEFQQYLRPETLFGGKFEQYLNQKTYVSPQNQTQRTQWDGTIVGDKVF